MRWLSKLTTVMILCGLAVAVVAGIVHVLTPRTLAGGFRTSALFRDAAGLPIGSRVMIAGVTVGQIDRLIIEGDQARVSMRLRGDVLLCDDAWATKKATSALGDNYVELSPGDADPSVASGCVLPHRRLLSGEPIPRVVEAATTDRVLRGIQNALPLMDERLASAEGFLDEGRQWVSGPFAERVARLDRELAEGRITRPLRQADDATGRLEVRTTDLAETLAGAAPGANRRMDRFAADIAGVTRDLRTARVDLAEAMGRTRAGIDDLDPLLRDAADVLTAMNEDRGEHPGRLARLINDPELADELTETTAGVASFTDSLDRLKTVIGFRTEFNLAALQPRFFVTAEVAARADQFYLVELEKGHWGDVPAPQLDDATGTATWTRRSLVKEGLRFSAQWGKRFGPMSLRIGFKESMFGAGVDGILGDGRLKLSLDVMESSFDRVPRVKLAAALAVFRTLYVIGGIDDALIPGADLPIQSWPTTADVPIQFQELHYGRDYFVGLHLSFNDTDMNRLLFLYGGLIGALITR